MKTKFLAAVGVMAFTVLLVGCYSKVSGGHRVGVPWASDKVEGWYQRTVPEVFNAAKAVISYNGTLISEQAQLNTTNKLQTLIGKVKQRNVYVKVLEVDPSTTEIIVQARTSAGGSDIELAHQLEKEVALKLIR